MAEGSASIPMRNLPIGSAAAPSRIPHLRRVRPARRLQPCRPTRREQRPSPTPRRTSESWHPPQGQKRFRAADCTSLPQAGSRNKVGPVRDGLEDTQKRPTVGGVRRTIETGSSFTIGITSDKRTRIHCKTSSPFAPTKGHSHCRRPFAGAKGDYKAGRRLQSSRLVRVARHPPFG
jgi:hypothetical protein